MSDAAAKEKSSRRPLPLLEPETSYYWTGGAKQQLLIQRCQQCNTYQHPPLPRCAACASEQLAPQPVSGRGRVATFTINYESWLPNMVVPFVYGVVELVEQKELYVFTNILCPIDQVASGMPVSVCFERHEDVYLPMFRPEENAHAG